MFCSLSALLFYRENFLDRTHLYFKTTSHRYFLRNVAEILVTPVLENASKELVWISYFVFRKEAAIIKRMTILHSRRLCLNFDQVFTICLNMKAITHCILINQFLEFKNVFMYVCECASIRLCVLVWEVLEGGIDLLSIPKRVFYFASPVFLESFESYELCYNKILI